MGRLLAPAFTALSPNRTSWFAIAQPRLPCRYGQRGRRSATPDYYPTISAPRALSVGAMRPAREWRRSERAGTYRKCHACRDDVRAARLGRERDAYIDRSRDTASPRGIRLRHLAVRAPPRKLRLRRHEPLLQRAALARKYERTVRRARANVRVTGKGDHDGPHALVADAEQPPLTGVHAGVWSATPSIDTVQHAARLAGLIGNRVRARLCFAPVFALMPPTRHRVVYDGATQSDAQVGTRTTARPVTTRWLRACDGTRYRWCHGRSSLKAHTNNARGDG